MPEIQLNKIQPNHLNPRLEFRKQALDELANSIEHVGLIEPIIVRPSGKGKYEIVVGERRYRAILQAGLRKVPVIIRNYSDEEVYEINLIENIQREDLSAVEKAKLIQQMMDRFPNNYSTWKEVGEKIGVAESTVREWLRTLDLPKQIQTMIASKEVERVPKGKIDYKTAMRISRAVEKPQKQIEIAKEFARQQISWRESKEVLREFAKQPKRSIRRVMQEVIDEAPVNLPFSKVHADAIVKKVKTQTARKTKDPRLQPGSTVRAQVTHFADLEVTTVIRKKLGDFDDADAKREGGYTLDEFKEVWKRLHGEWNPDEAVYVIQFRLLKVVGEET